MTMRLTSVLLLLCGVILAAGLTLGLTPLPAAGSDCGSAFSPSTAAAHDDTVSEFSGALSGRAADATAADQRAAATSSRRGMSLAWAIPGGLLVAAWVLTLLKPPAYKDATQAA
jgi:hypothetical protein